MTGNVIEFRLRRGKAVRPDALVRAARSGMSRRAFAAMSNSLVARPVKPGMISAWESGVPVPPDLMEACRPAAVPDSSRTKYPGRRQQDRRKLAA